MTAQTREERIRDLLPLVRQTARRVARMVAGSDVDDLIGDGSVGLIRAVDCYDASHGVPLEQYARRVVLGAMLNGVRRLDPVSERVRRTIRIAERERFSLAHRHGALPSAREMERRFPGLGRARTDAYRGTPLSLDAPLPLGERLEPDWTTDPQHIHAMRAEGARVRCAIAALPARWRSIVVAHYFCDRSLRSLGAADGISPQRISQLHRFAIDRLRSDLSVPA